MSLAIALSVVLLSTTALSPYLLLPRVMCSNSGGACDKPMRSLTIKIGINYLWVWRCLWCRWPLPPGESRSGSWGAKSSERRTLGLEARRQTHPPTPPTGVHARLGQRVKPEWRDCLEETRTIVMRNNTVVINYMKRSEPPGALGRTWAIDGVRQVSDSSPISSMLHSAPPSRTWGVGGDAEG